MVQFEICVGQSNKYEFKSFVIFFYFYFYETDNFEFTLFSYGKRERYPTMYRISMKEMKESKLKWKWKWKTVIWNHRNYSASYCYKYDVKCWIGTAKSVPAIMTMNTIETENVCRKRPSRKTLTTAVIIQKSIFEVLLNFISPHMYKWIQSVSL